MYNNYGVPGQNGFVPGKEVVLINLVKMDISDCDSDNNMQLTRFSAQLSYKIISIAPRTNTETAPKCDATSPRFNVVSLMYTFLCHLTARLGIGWGGPKNLLYGSITNVIDL